MRVDTICDIIAISLILYILNIINSNIYSVSVYENQTKFNYFAYHLSTWIWKVFYWAIIFKDKLCSKQCDRSPQDW